MRYAVAVVLVSAELLAQSGPPSCPADLPVDDILAQVHEQQSKKKHRNRNPLPELYCIGLWCLDRSRTPPTFPEPTLPAKTRNDESTTSNSDSSSKSPKEKCDERMQTVLQAAHDVDVGDYYFQDKDYRGALMRYKDALEEKPDDAAIRVRLGRVLEKLNQIPEAIEQYQAAWKLAGPEKWSDEAKSALQRLQRPAGL